MECLKVEETKASPLVDFNPNTNILSIKGQSYPENALKFYMPIFEWLKEYFKQLSNEAIFNIELSYLNTSSTKCIMDFMDMLEDEFGEGKKIKLNWYYDEENDSIYECVEEIKEDLSFPFEIISIESGE